MAVPKKYKKTFLACFLGIMNQSVVGSVTAILFVPFMSLYGFRLWQLGVLIGTGFITQVFADIMLTFFVDKFGFRPQVNIALALSLIGILFFASTPYIFAETDMFIGIITATILFSFPSGMLEVLISPIVENVPSEQNEKGGIMSLIHSFYAWGQIFIIVIISLYVFIAGKAYWNLILYFLAIIPIVSFIAFSIAPLDKRETLEKKKSKIFFSPYFVIACIAIMAGGASELIINQYVSTFTELSLGFSKLASDLFGMCMFAALFGFGRTLYGSRLGKKLNLHKLLIIGSLITAGLYLVAGLSPVPAVSLVACILCGFTVSLLWPGTLVVAGEKFHTSGAWIFSVLAVAGDVGAGIGPMLTGFLANAANLETAIAVSAVIPLVSFICHIGLYRNAPATVPPLKKPR
ncbi:MAG: MFS transporter [Clostridiales bacterium]|jgi:MFS family permease|nr:MFS transporter [Clostridiales bacterium]